MTVSDYWNSKLPDYYPTMYLDGYEPWQIMQAHRNTFNRELKEKQERALAEKELEETNINLLRAALTSFLTCGAVPTEI